MSADAALSRIAPASGARIDPPTLLPARTILELSGEAVRARLCTFTDATGEEIALRPDMTTPIASQAAAGQILFQRYHYSGAVYRLSQPGSDETIEFRQVGFEWFGGGGPAEDAEAAALTAEAAAAGAITQGDSQLRFGDMALFRAVVDALPFSPRWRERLKRAFFRRKGPRDLLAADEKSGGASSPLADSLAALPEAEAQRAVEEIFAIAGVQPVGGRGAAEIAERLRDIAGDRTPPADAAARLIAYLKLEAPADKCVAKLQAFARDAKLDIASAVERFEACLAGVKKLDAPFWKSAAFSAEAGRRFEYYDGFVFELAPRATPDRPSASGGRYDGLIAKLSGGARTAPAIGAALRADRLGSDRNGGPA